MRLSRRTRGRVLAAAWSALLLVTGILIAHPVGNGLTRLAVAVAVPTLWIGAVLLLRKHRTIALAILVPGIVAVAFLCLPGRPPDVEELRAQYVRSLERYEGCPYVWGGENRFGIDCSGLVRRGLIDANLRLGLTTLNPRLVRGALAVWWYDCSARALRDGYRGMTRRLFRAESVNAIPSSALMPGDLAVTSSGVHVLACVGDGVWIQADPGPMKVIRVAAPTKNHWFTRPVYILRWAQFMGRARP